MAKNQLDLFDGPPENASRIAVEVFVDYVIITRKFVNVWTGSKISAGWPA